MLNHIVILIELFVSASAENPYRDRINITSCENEDGRPELTYVAPDYVIRVNDIHTYERIGEFTLQKTVPESYLEMFGYSDCKFSISLKILLRVLR